MLYQNHSIKKVLEPKFLPKIATVTLTLDLNLDCKFIQDIVALNICVKLYQNLSINKGARVTTKLF